MPLLPLTRYAMQKTGQLIGSSIHFKKDGHLLAKPFNDPPLEKYWIRNQINLNSYLRFCSASCDLKFHGPSI
jgi:hypothetical protein